MLGCNLHTVYIDQHLKNCLTSLMASQISILKVLTLLTVPPMSSLYWELAPQVFHLSHHILSLPYIEHQHHSALPVLRSLPTKYSSTRTRLIPCMMWLLTKRPPLPVALHLAVLKTDATQTLSAINSFI